MFFSSNFFVRRGLEIRWIGGRSRSRCDVFRLVSIDEWRRGVGMVLDSPPPPLAVRRRLDDAVVVVMDVFDS